MSQGDLARGSVHTVRLGSRSRRPGAAARSLRSVASTVVFAVGRHSVREPHRAPGREGSKDARLPPQLRFSRSRLTTYAPQSLYFLTGGGRTPKLPAVTHSLAISPDICSSESRPSSTRMWQKPISLMYSSFISSGICAFFASRKSVPTMSRPQYPLAHSSSTTALALSKSPCAQLSRAFLMRRGCGWSHTLKTFSLEMKPKPAYVAWALLSACSHIERKHKGKRRRATAR